MSIIPRGIAALGYTQQVPTEDRYVLRKSELLDRLDVLLGGRVAEEIVFGDVSTGAENDLERATEMARHMVARYGMSERIGLATFGDADSRGLPPVVWQPGGERWSESTATRIDDEIQRLLAEAHDRVSRTLKERRDALERIAQYLLKHEVVDHEMLVRLVNDEPLLDDSAAGGGAAKRGRDDSGAPKLATQAGPANKADHSVPQ